VLKSKSPDAMTGPEAKCNSVFGPLQLE